MGLRICFNNCLNQTASSYVLKDQGITEHFELNGNRASFLHRKFFDTFLETGGRIQSSLICQSIHRIWNEHRLA